MNSLPLTQLHPHPRNPRFAPRQDVVEQIAAQIQAAGAFDPAHALIVRPRAEGYEILSGHHRALAAAQAGLTEVPCWVRELTDDEAYMALVLSNIQGELHPLEEGMHALESGLSGTDYAQQTGKLQSSIAIRVMAARVANRVIEYSIAQTDLCDVWMQLSSIHPAPAWLWPALVRQLLAEHWTVDLTRRHVKPLKDLAAPPPWSDAAAIATAVVDGTLQPAEVPRFCALVEASVSRLTRAAEDADRFISLLGGSLDAARPGKLSDVTALCLALEHEQAALRQERQQADLFRTRRQEEIAARTSRLRRTVSLEEWHTLAPDEQQALLHLSPQDVEASHFNRQDTDAIEWAQFSWNPVTGCLHNCPYCYARDLAESVKLTRAYPNGFAPTFRPATLLAPRHMSVPAEAAHDTRYRNVFTCSMADLFGRWVPAAWIDAVFREVRAAPQWHFLCLTKFPKRLDEFDIPPNAWMGTTVDLQARVKAAEDAFAHIHAGVRWLSVEPMLEPLRFTHLERFDWVVIGGATKSSQTPAWHPPFAWIYDLVQQADAAGCRVYFKTNLLGKRRLQLPFDAPLPDDTEPPPPVFAYLKPGGATDGAHDERPR